MNQKILLWMIVSALTFFGQLLLGSDFIFSVTSLAIFCLVPFVVRAYLFINNIGALIFIATFAKLFIVSQWLKILYLQPAGSNLQSPQQTAFILLLGLLAFWAAALAATPLLRGRSAPVRIPQDPLFLTWLAAAAALLTLIGSLGRHFLGYDRIGESEYVEGQGHVLLLYFDTFLPLTVAALTARAALLSSGRRFVDGFVLTALATTVLQGFWENTRTAMVSGGVAFLATYWVYGGKFSKRHLLGLALSAMLMQWLVFPLIDIQRGLPRNLSATEFISETLRIAGDLTDQRTRAGHDEQLENTYLSWDTRLYYGNPTGFFDRFAPNPVDEVVTYIDRTAPFGIDALTEQIAFIAPNLVLKPLGLERPTRGGEQIELAALGTITNMNYGLFAEIYAYVEPFLFLPICIFLIFIYITVAHMIYGGLQKNYFVVFFFSLSFFSIAVEDISALQAEIGIRGALHLAVFWGVRLLVRLWETGRPHEAEASGR